MIIALGSNPWTDINRISKILKQYYGFKVLYISRKIYISCCEVFGINFTDFNIKDEKLTKTYKLYGMSAKKIFSEYVKFLCSINSNIFSILTDRIINTIKKNNRHNYVVPDVKRLSEYNKLKNEGAIMIKVEKKNSTDKSYKELDGAEWDFVITYSDNYEDLLLQINFIMNKLGIEEKQHRLL